MLPYSRRDKIGVHVDEGCVYGARLTPSGWHATSAALNTRGTQVSNYGSPPPLIITEIRYYGASKYRGGAAGLRRHEMRKHDFTGLTGIGRQLTGRRKALLTGHCMILHTVTGSSKIRVNTLPCLPRFGAFACRRSVIDMILWKMRRFWRIKA